MTAIRPSTVQDSEHVLGIWRRAIDATHDFLSPADRAGIEEELTSFLPTAPMLLAVDQTDRPVGFMLLREGHMDALFIEPRHHGKGLGKALVHEAARQFPNLTTDVNEQNTQAIGFYEHLGFRRIGRSPVDGQGRAYPLLHLRLTGAEKGAEEETTGTPT